MSSIILARVSIEECRYNEGDNHNYLPKDNEHSLKISHAVSHKEIFFKGFIEPWKKEGLTRDPSIEISYEKLRSRIFSLVQKKYNEIINAVKFGCILTITTIAVHALVSSLSSATILSSLFLTVCKIVRFIAGFATIISIGVVRTSIKDYQYANKTLSQLPLNGSDDDKRKIGSKILDEKKFFHGVIQKAFQELIQPHWEQLKSNNVIVFCTRNDWNSIPNPKTTIKIKH